MARYTNDYPTHRSLDHNVHHLVEEADVVAGPEAVPQGEEEHGDGERQTPVSKPLQTRVDVPEQGPERDKERQRIR